MAGSIGLGQEAEEIVCRVACFTPAIEDPRERPFPALHGRFEFPRAGPEVVRPFREELVQIAERCDDEWWQRHIDGHARLVLRVEEESPVLRHAIFREAGRVRDAQTGVAQEVEVATTRTGLSLP